MPTAYIEIHKDGVVTDSDTLSAMLGIANMSDYKISYLPFDYRLEVFSNRRPFEGIALGDVACGDLRFCHAAMAMLGVSRPSLPDYPTQLDSYLGRYIRRMDITDAFKLALPIFIKPTLPKQWPGQIVDDWSGLIHHVHAGVRCYVSDPIDILTEYRVFVHKGAIVGAKHYGSGDYRLMPDWATVDEMVAAWHDAPIAYSLDVGLLRNGATVLVEVNDFYALGSYGLDSLIYAKALVDRWHEIVGV